MNAAEAQEDTPAKAPPGSLAELYHAWRHFFWLLGLILSVVLFYAEENWRGPRAWENYQRAQAAKGESLKASAFVPAAVLDEQNFAVAPAVAPLFRMRNQAFAPRFDAASSAFKGSKRDISNSWVKARTDLIAWHAAFLQPTNQNTHQALRTVEVSTNITVQAAASNVLAALAETDALFEKLGEASRRPYSRFDLPYLQDDPAAILLPHLAPLKHLCQVLQLRANAELALGKTDEAAGDIKLILYLADACRTEPLVISQLVRLAQVQLALQPIAEGMNQWSDAQLAGFQAQLARFDFCADSRRSLQAERVLFGGGIIDYVMRSPNKMQMISNLGNNGNNLNSELAGALMTIAPSGWFYLEKFNYVRTFADSILPIINVPGHQINPAMSRRAENQINSLLHHSAPGLFLRHRFFSALLMPSLSHSARRTAFVQTALEEAAVACGLQRYRLANGRYPDSLDSLAPQFIAKLPHDIINGQLLKYRRTENGRYVLYSVGWNETDDGGKIGLTTQEIGRNNETGNNVKLEDGDWVWRPWE